MLRRNNSVEELLESRFVVIDRGWYRDHPLRTRRPASPKLNASIRGIESFDQLLATDPTSPIQLPNFALCQSNACVFDNFSNYVMRHDVTASSNALNPYTGPWGFDQAAHLARRALFGATTSDINTLKILSMSQAVDMLLADQPAPKNPPLVWYHTDIGGVTQGQTWVNLDFNMDHEFTRVQSLESWWMGLMIGQNLSIREKMVLFWHNHFATSAITVGDARYMYIQNVLFRTNALGNFKSLVKSITLDPAMLRYLSGNLNIASAPNENYGRELQELFTIGKGPEISSGNYTTYTEADVKAAARVLTGWSDDPKGLTYIYTSANHDPADIQFSANYGNTVIKGAADGFGAIREIDDLLTMIFDQDATAQYIVRKLYRWFVDYVIDDSVEQNVIVPLAQFLKTNNYEIRPTLSMLLKSTQFYNTAYQGCVIKTPIDLIVGTLRTLSVTMPNTQDVLDQYYGWIGLNISAAQMQMGLLAPPNVAGWPAYYQAPEYHEIWINSDTLDSRVKFEDDIATNSYQIAVHTNLMSSIDPIQLAKQSSDPSTAATLISDWVRLLLASPLTTDQMTTLHNTLLPGLPDYEWTAEWNAYISNSTDATKKKAVSDRLLLLLKYILDLAEYQLM